MVKSKNGVSAKGVTKLDSTRGCGFGGVREVIVRFAMIKRKRIRKAQMRMAHGNPSCVMSAGSMIGYMTPPREEPATAIPSARARRRKNQELTVLIAV